MTIGHNGTPKDERLWAQAAEDGLYDQAQQIAASRLAGELALVEHEGEGAEPGDIDPHELEAQTVKPDPRDTLRFHTSGTLASLQIHSSPDGFYDF